MKSGVGKQSWECITIFIFQRRQRNRYGSSKKNGRDLEFASDDLKNDPEVVMAAVKQDPGALEYASYMQYISYCAYAVKI